MFNVFIIISLLNLVELKNYINETKNWINSCNVATCLIAINQCIQICKSIEECKICLINRDQICSFCANDIFDTAQMTTINDVSYLYCDEYDSFQKQVCQIFCKAKSKDYGECKKIQSFSSCICYNTFNGNLNNTAYGSAYIWSLAKSNYDEFAVGFANGDIGIYDNYANVKQIFSVQNGDFILGLAFLLNGEIFATGSFGTRLYSKNGMLIKVYSTKYGNAVCILKNGDLVYDSVTKIYIQNPFSDVHRLELNGHLSTVTSLLSLPNNDLVSGSDDQTIRIWNTFTGALKNTLIGHTSYVLSLALLESGDIASSSADKTIKIWHIISGHNIKTIRTDHIDWIRSIVLLPNGKIASASSDNSIKIWDKDSGSLIKTLSDHEYSVMSLVVNSNNCLVSVSYDSVIRIWH